MSLCDIQETSRGQRPVHDGASGYSCIQSAHFSYYLCSLTTVLACPSLSKRVNVRALISTIRQLTAEQAVGAGRFVCLSPVNLTRSDLLRLLPDTEATEKKRRSSMNTNLQSAAKDNEHQQTFSDGPQSIL